MSATESLYHGMVAEGDHPEAPRPIRVDHRGDEAVVPRSPRACTRC